MIVFNTEAEKAILACMIHDNALISKIQPNFKAEYFYSQMNQSLYCQIIKLFEENKAVDMPMLFDFNLEYVADIYNSLSTTQNAKHYVSIVRNLGIRRELIKASEKVREIALTEDIDNIEIVKSESLAALNNVQIPSIQKTPTKAFDVVMSSINNLEMMYKQGINANRNWGIKWLQDKTGGVKQEFTILAARPSIGKSAFALQIAKEICLQGGKVAIFTLEMSAEDCMNRLICNYGNINKDYFDKPGTLDEKGWEQIGLVAPHVAKMNLRIFDDVFYVEELILKCEELIASEGIDFVILDYIQLMETSKKTSNPNERVAHISRQLKKMQQRNKIQLLALSQFNRESENQSVPTLRNLRDSGSLEQDANNVWFLHVEQANTEAIGGLVEVQLIIAKQRNGERNIMKKLKFYGKTQKFFEN